MTIEHFSATLSRPFERLPIRDPSFSLLPQVIKQLALNDILTRGLILYLAGKSHQDHFVYCIFFLLR